MLWEVMDTKGKTMFSGIKVALCHEGKRPHPLSLQIPTRNQQDYVVPKIVEALRRDRWGCFQRLGVGSELCCSFLTGAVSFCAL